MFTVYIPLQLCPLVLGLFQIQIFFYTILLESFKISVILRRFYIINDVCVLSNEFIEKTSLHEIVLLKHDNGYKGLGD